MSGYNHDHDEELGMYWYGDQYPKAAPRLPSGTVASPKRRSGGDIPGGTRWCATWALAMDYFSLQSGEASFADLKAAFVFWLKRNPTQFRRFVQGDDMTRAEFIDRFLAASL